MTLRARRSQSSILASQLLHNHRGANPHAIVEIDHVLVGQADAVSAVIRKVRRGMPVC